MNTRPLYRLLSIAGDIKAATRGPGPYVRRQARKAALRESSRALRKIIRP